MNLTGVIVKNVTVQIIGRAIGTVFGFITLAILTRYLGTFGYGEFTTATSFLQFVGVIVDFGLTLTAVQMLSEPGADEPRVLGNLVSLRLLTAVGMFAVAPIIALAFPWGGNIHAAIAVGAVSFVFLAVHQIFVGLFQRTMRMELSALAELLGRLALLISTIIAVSIHATLPILILSLAIGNLVMLAFSFFFARRLRPFSLHFDRAIIATIIRRSWPIALSILFNLIYLRGDMIILSLTHSQSEVGLYGAAYKPLDVITALPMMFMGLVLPLLVQSWATRDHERTAHLLRRSTDAVSMLAFPIALGGIALGTPAMIFLAGEAFRDAGPLLALLTVAAGCVFFGSLFGHAIVALQKQRLMIWVYGIDALICLALYLIFIPPYGAVAGALITILSELTIAVSAGFIVLRTSRTKLPLRVPLLSLLSSVLMALVVTALPDFHVLIRMAIGAIVYVSLLVSFGAISKQDLRALITKSA